MAKATCTVCPHHCTLEEGQLGICRARRNAEGHVVAENYGRVTSLALDPIEKKPLACFHPGSKVLSVGSYGCNLRCPFCQNSEISMARAEQVECRTMTPEELVELALEARPRGNRGLAFTYNEPLVGLEFVEDCAYLARERGLDTVLVSNGYVCEEPFRRLVGSISAANIDFKAFDDTFYQRCGGSLGPVLTAIRIAYEAGVHVELTTLVIPGLNDSPQQMEEEAAWIAGLDPAIPLHLTRFFPRYHMANVPPTPLTTLRDLERIANKHLSNVFLGNV